MSTRHTQSDQFTFGLWTVGNPGRDPFGEVVRAAARSRRDRPPVGGLGAYGVSLHDNDLVPYDASLR